MVSELDKNLHDVENLLQRFRHDVLPHFINGKTCAGTSGAVFTNATPIDNSVIGAVAAGNADDIDAACNAAAAAFGEWKNTPAKERKKFCTRSLLTLKPMRETLRSSKVMTPDRRCAS